MTRTMVESLHFHAAVIETDFETFCLIFEITGTN